MVKIKELTEIILAHNDTVCALKLELLEYTNTMKTLIQEILPTQKEVQEYNDKIDEIALQINTLEIEIKNVSEVLKEVVGI